MRTTDWNYDFLSLPCWNDREKLWDVYDEYHEVPQSDLLFCLYSIAERRMLDYRGYLAIFRNKTNPELVINISEYTFCQTFFANKAGSLICLQPCVYIRKQNRTIYPILVVDIENNCFACALTRNTSRNCQITQGRAQIFTVDISGQRTRKIRGRWLKWHPLEQLPQLPRYIGI